MRLPDDDLQPAPRAHLREAYQVLSTWQWKIPYLQFIPVCADQLILLINEWWWMKCWISLHSFFNISSWAFIRCRRSKSNLLVKIDLSFNVPQTWASAQLYIRFAFFTIGIIATCCLVLYLPWFDSWCVLSWNMQESTLQEARFLSLGWCVKACL